MTRRLGWSLSFWALPVLLLLFEGAGGQERREPPAGRDVVLTTEPVIPPQGGTGSTGPLEDRRPAAREKILSSGPSPEEEKEEREREREKLDRSMEMLRNLTIDLRRPPEAPKPQPQAPSASPTVPVQ
jgi:hypothetical protein